MNSGKTLALLTKAFMLRQKGYSVLLMKPELDDRTATISSRIGLEEDCIIIPRDKYPNTDMGIGINQKPDYILIDEAQFLSKDQVWDISNIVDYFDVNVICYGLKLNWKGELFEGSQTLIALADDLQQMDSFCKETGNPALFHWKKGGSDAAFETGYEEMYDTVSRKIWKERRCKE
jgi:thymidine kinase